MSGRTIVVGAGLSGLSAAHALARRGGDVLVLEASDRAGGVVRTQRRDGFLLELGPNTVRPSAAIWGLIQELGLANEVLVADPRSPRFIDFGGTLHAVPMSPGALLGTRLLSTAGKLRLVAEPFHPAGADPEESIRDFAARRLGAEVADRLVAPFVAGIFAGDAAKLSAAAAFPTLGRWEREHGSLFRGAMAARRDRKQEAVAGAPKGLLALRQGLEALPRALAAALGPAVRFGAPVRAVAPRGNGWIVQTVGDKISADRLILAAPAHRVGALISGFAPEAALALAGIPHPPLAVLHLSWAEASLARPLRGFGHLVAESPNRRILGAVWSSSLFPGRAPAGQSLLTVFMGGSRDSAALALPDEELVATAARDLASEGLVRGAPQPLRVTRWSQAIPQYERGHSQRLAALTETERRFPSLRFAGNYRGGVSVSDVIAGGMAAAR
ncbi:MAG: protoporphyrinogen oxidase [Acidobacteriota bacterium]